MKETEIIEALQNKLNFNNKAIKKLIVFHDYLLRWNKKYNLISKNTENQVRNDRSFAIVSQGCVQSNPLYSARLR